MYRHRIMVTMKPEQVRALDGFSLESKRTGGRKLSRASIIRAMARVAKGLNINVDGVRTEDEFKQRVWEAIEQHKK